MQMHVLQHLAIDTPTYSFRLSFSEMCLFWHNCIESANKRMVWVRFLCSQTQMQNDSMFINQILAFFGMCTQTSFQNGPT